MNSRHSFYPSSLRKRGIDCEKASGKALLAVKVRSKLCVASLLTVQSL